MSLRKHQSGFSVFELILVLAFVGILALAGYMIYNHQSKTIDSTASTPSSSKQASAVSSAPAVSSASDLDKASQLLDQNDPTAANSNDSSQLDSQTSVF